MKFAFIAREKATFPIDLLCTVLGVSRAGFYAAQQRPVTARRSEDQQLAVHVAAAHAASRKRYGSPRVYRELQAQGHEVGRHRVARLMREQGLRARAKRRFQRTTDPSTGSPSRRTSSIDTSPSRRRTRPGCPTSVCRSKRRRR